MFVALFLFLIGIPTAEIATGAVSDSYRNACAEIGGVWKSDPATCHVVNYR